MVVCAAASCVRLLAREIHGQGCDDLADHLVLQREHLDGRAVVPFGPQMPAVERVDELGVDPDVLAVPPHAALQHVANPQILGDLLHLGRLVLVGPARVAGDDEDARQLGEVGDQILGHAVREVTLLRVATQIVEGQDRDRRLCRQGLRHALNRRRLELGRPGPPPDHRGDRQGDDGQRRSHLPSAHACDLDGSAHHRRDQRCGLVVQDYAVDRHRLGDVLDVLLAQVLEFQVELALDLVVDVAGEADSAGLG